MKCSTKQKGEIKGKSKVRRGKGKEPFSSDWANGK
jgi:hypothetical protein